MSQIIDKTNKMNCPPSEDSGQPGPDINAILISNNAYMSQIIDKTNKMNCSPSEDSGQPGPDVINYFDHELS